MTNYKWPKGLGKADRCQVAGNGAEKQAVEAEKENAADTEQQTTCKHPKADTDVVVDVEAEHRDICV